MPKHGRSFLTTLAERCECSFPTAGPSATGSSASTSTVDLTLKAPDRPLDRAHPVGRARDFYGIAAAVPCPTHVVAHLLLHVARPTVGHSTSDPMPQTLDDMLSGFLNDYLHER